LRLVLANWHADRGLTPTAMGWRRERGWERGERASIGNAGGLAFFFRDAYTACKPAAQGGLRYSPVNQRYGINSLDSTGGP
jgi:hypothetical protein